MTMNCAPKFSNDADIILFLFCGVLKGYVQGARAPTIKLYGPLYALGLHACFTNDLSWVLVNIITELSCYFQN